MSKDQKSTSKFVLHGVRPHKPKTRPSPRVADPTSPGTGAGNDPNLLYRGGPVLFEPTVWLVFLGDWTSTANQNRATRLGQYVTDFLGSSYMNVLSQYGTGSTGTNAGSVFLPNTIASLTHADLVNLLQGAINSANPATHLPEPVTPYACMIFLDNNTGVDDTSVPGSPTVLCDGTNDNAFGYHTFFTTTAGNPFYYGVTGGLTDTCINQGCPPGTIGCSLNTTLTQEQRQTVVCSHELSEMFTNPQNSGVIATSDLAWVDLADQTGEIGDICAFTGTFGTITVGSNTWSVQPMFSKIDDQETNGATTCITSAPSPLPSLLPACSLILARSTFGQDEVNYLIQHDSHHQAEFQDAFYVLVDGFTPDELGLNSGNLTSPPNLPTFTGSFSTLGDPQISFDTTTGVQLAEPGNWWNIQRITFPFNVTFSSTTAFAGLSSANPAQVYDLVATITNTVTQPGYPTLTAESAPAEFELVYQADPYMSPGSQWWLSADMRVFTVTPATLPMSKIPLAYSQTQWPSNGDPNTYITNLINELNTNFTDPATGNTPFTGISPDEQQSALYLTSTDTSGNPVYNFGLARVHLEGDSASDVRMFFRLFIGNSPDTDFETGTTFRSNVETDNSGNPIPGTRISLLGFPSSDMPTTIPFYAAARIDTTAWPLTHQSDGPNVQTIPSPTIPTPPPPGTPVDAYFACYLDINQGTARFPLNPSTLAHPDGPYTSAEIVSLPEIIMGNHACLVAEISYDSAPIPPGSNANSDKIGQRNLQWVPSDNPGPAAGHVVPTLFDVRPTSALIPAADLPDELMIDWGKTPPGSVASIYWPQLNADDVLELASRFYTSHVLRKKDAHTIEVTTGAVTYIPIPASAGPHLAGLMSIDLPLTVHVGEEFDVVVRRVSWRSQRGANARGGFAANDAWRYVVGAFQIKIPVSTGPRLLTQEEQLLGLFKWKLDVLPPSNRWHPVLQRYVEQVSGRVEGFGGNPASVPPLPPGTPFVPPGHHGGPHPGGHDHDDGCTGKVDALIYDGFGDFQGFVLVTNEGHERRYHSHEPEIEELVREAWETRTLVTVYSEEHDQDRPVALVLRRWHGDR
jgi:hypothetical protein